MSENYSTFEAAAALDGTEAIPCSQGSGIVSAKKTTPTAIATYVSSVAVAANNTFTGLQTFSQAPRIPVSAINAAGANQTDATAVSANGGLVVVSAGDDAKGVKLPTAAAGYQIIIKNANAANAVKVYPATAGTINAIAANGAYTIAANTSAFFIGANSVNWVTVPFAAS
jgi:hypothetical protein